ncbi:hypothetical protein L3Y34_001484 [Caenorhabditis briggsae]|uniref:Uncharacterized protein n=1 Tax=Caenorhabditis briggsae TaxID=6238 RepID=A0AAE9IR75_CAEBR|nr:hypothetical protein L3Y34_001484 [Caenorhabditis briggsae]
MERPASLTDLPKGRKLLRLSRRNKTQLKLDISSGMPFLSRPASSTSLGGIASTNNNGMIGSLCRDSRAPSRNSRSGSSRSQQAKHQPIDPDEPSTSGTTDRRPSTHFMLDLPVVSTRLRKLSEAFFNAQHGDKIDHHHGAVWNTISHHSRLIISSS